MATDRVPNVQDVFLNHVRKNKINIVIFLVNGVKLQGIALSFDSQSVLIRRDGNIQLIFKHAISTIVPMIPISLFEGVVEK